MMWRLLASVLLMANTRRRDRSPSSPKSDRSNNRPMKRSLLAAGAMLLISTAAASALELNCGTPHVAVGDDPRDNNPVVKIDVRYIPDDHEWRVFHYLRNGLVVSRTEQYAIMDASNDRKTQWQGSLKRNRSLYMIGEVKRVEDGAVYLEWIYDRNKGNALVMQATARCAMAAPSLPQPTAQAPTLPANPQSNTLYHSGYWTVFAGVSNEGRPLCGLRADGNDRTLYVKHFKDVPGLTIHVFKDGWAFPRNGIDVPVTVSFGSMNPLSADGQGWRIKDPTSASFVEFHVQPSYSVKFLELLSSSKQMQVAFREGNEPAWLINLAGSDNVVAAFAQCVVNLDTTTQPFSQ